MNKRGYLTWALLTLCVLLSIGMSLTLWKGVSYHSELVKLRTSLTHVDKRIQPRDHIGSRPLYIFADKKVQWKDLVPYLETLYGKHVEKKIVGTFPVPHNFKGTDLTHVKSDDDRIYFPSYGRFYLHTTVGFFKILLLNPELSEDEKILLIGSFVSGNAVHSLADVAKIRSNSGEENDETGLLRKNFFASDQPLKLHCGQIARFLALILSQLNYRVQQIQLFDQNRKPGHIVIQVFLPKKNKFAMIDPDYGAIVRDKSGNVLSIQEIAVLVRKKPDSIMIEDIGNKHWLREIYNHPEPMPDFAWTPDKSGNIKAVRKEDYLQVMKKNTAVYWIHDRSAGEWEYPNKFHWDGTSAKKNKASLKSSRSLSFESRQPLI